MTEKSKKNQNESIRISISSTEELINFSINKVLAENKAGADKPTEIERF